MHAKLKEWQNNPSSAPEVMVMYGAGDKAFSAGGDLKYVYEAINNKDQWEHLFWTYN